MSNRLSSVFPRPSANDPDDVVWTLQTAAVQWQRGLRADAIVWVRKAADTATQMGLTPRAEELRDQAARLAEYLWSDPEDPEQEEATLARPGARRVSHEEDDEVIEVEEIDGLDLELGEGELPTPDDAVASISPEELASYRAPEPDPVLPDDLDLRSDSERAAAAAAAHDSFMSVSPEPDNGSSGPPRFEGELGRDSYISVSPEPDDDYMEVSPESLPVLAPPVVPAIPAPPPVPRTVSKAPRAAAQRPPALQGFDGPTRPSIANPALIQKSRSKPARKVTSRRPAAKPAPPPKPSDSPTLDGLMFDSVQVLSDLPEEAQAALAAAAERITLEVGQALILQEGAAVVTRGNAHVTLTSSDVSAGKLGAGAVVAARGSLEASPLRLVADASPTVVVRWSDRLLAESMHDCPWVVDDLRRLADRFQAHACAGLGPLGTRLDDALRAAVYERLEVRVLSPSESIAERGKPLKGLFVVATGELEVENGGGRQRIGSGEFVFPGCVIGAEPAPSDVRAGPQGGLVLYATRPVAHELMMSVPPLLEILAS